jgi:predicted AAA+ superfamily ATPase
MITRPFWLEKLRAAWRTRPIVWLSGVRRVGKTCLARMLPDALLMNCDLPSVQQRMADAESFFMAQPGGQIIVLDEIHRLPDPSSVLKVAADAFPTLRILATGSSTLAATRKFRDALTGRKWPVYLCPVLWDECWHAFQVRDLDRRLLHGGLPEPLLASVKDQAFFAEWLDSYYARDIAELFGVRDRTGFMTLLRLLLVQSGGLVDYTKLASACGVSRHTVKAHLEAMSIAHAVFALRPFHGGGRSEITHRPKLYAFDTGFVTFARGWDTLREEDRGVLWEHLVLDALRAAGAEPWLAYWRDKSGRELDFVLARGAKRVDVIECKMTPERFAAEVLDHFRGIYPHGSNYLVCPHVTTAYTRRLRGHAVSIVNTTDLARALRLHAPASAA